MRRIIGMLLFFCMFFVSETHVSNPIIAKDSNLKNNLSLTEGEVEKDSPTVLNVDYEFPAFYRGIYLNISSALNLKKLTKFVELAKSNYINTFVLDVQSASYRKSIVPETNVQYLLDNKIHPIARIVVFPDGLKRYPVPQGIIDEKLEIAESACKNGFKEIQFDYIRFNDSAKNRHVSLKERYRFIEGFLQKARNHLKKYNVKIAADIFGRIPLNSGDIIGQRIEGLDRVVDIICPMAYPSHYTWSKKYYANPYYTVLRTSSSARKRTQNAEIVTYIQGFKMKLSGIPFKTYIEEQIKAIHDSGVRGFIIWNARQHYKIPLRVTKSYYKSNPDSLKKVQVADRDKDEI